MRFVPYLASVVLHRLFRPMSTVTSPPSSTESILREIYDASFPRNVFSISVTGGGVQALSWLFSVPGASNSVIEGSVPYSRQSIQRMFKTLGEENLTGSCSVETAKFMAKAAYYSAVEHILLNEANVNSLSTANCFGISCNAALVSDIPKKGAHRCHVVVYFGRGYSVYSLELNKSKMRSRLEEDRMCSQLLLEALATQCNIILPPQSMLLPSDSNENVEICKITHNDIVDDVRNGRLSHALVFPSEDGSLHSLHCPIPAGCLVFPGSFNPLHDGHIELVKANLRVLKSQNDILSLVVFEIAIYNADKPSLSKDEIDCRIKQFLSHTEDLQGIRYAICITSQPLFIGKSKIFKGCRFILGADTARRLIDSKYYGEKSVNANDETRQLLNMISALTIMQQNGCSFIVGGRVKESNGVKVFERLQDVLRENSCGFVLPRPIIDMFIELDEEDFRVDLSSTELRNKFSSK